MNQEFNTLKNFSFQKEKPENFNLLDPNINKNLIEILNIKQEKIKILKKYLKDIKKTKNITSEDFYALNNFLSYNFGKLKGHDFVSKFNSISNIFNQNAINKLKNKKKIDEKIDKKDINYLISILEYCLAYTGEKETTQISFENFKNLLENDILDFFGEKGKNGNIKVKVRIDKKYEYKPVSINIIDNIKNKNFNLNIIKGDMYFLIINMIKNAVKHGKANKIDFIFEEKDGNLIFEIKDNGGGIKGFDNLEDIFIEGKTTDGSGIGIGKAKERLALIDGKIEVSSQENGTIFTIKIPKKS